MELIELGKIEDIVRLNLPVGSENIGKMIRSRIGLYFLKALDIDVDDTFVKFLTVVELIHNASLLHDDVIDNGDERRNSPALNKVYGEKTSVLYGNITLVNAMSILLDIGDLELITEMNNCVKKMCYGELMQQKHLNKIPTINEYIKKTRLKTASLFRYMMSGLSILLNGQYRTEFESFGDNYGIGFQISNDLADYSGGAEHSSDIKNGIFTAPVIYAKSIKTDTVAIDKTNDLMDNYLKRARGVLDFLNESEYKTALIGVIKCLKV